MLITVPLVLGYLGTERFGIWIAVTSLLLLFTFADLGLGNGLINLVSAADALGDRQGEARAVSSAFFMLLGLALVLGILAVVIVPRVNWASVFNATSATAAAEAGPAVAALVAAFLVGLPIGVVARIQTGHQEGFANSIWVIIGSSLGLAAILVVMSLGGGLPWLVLAFAGAPVAASALNGIVLFRRRHPWLKPSWAHVDGATARKLLRVGGLFFVLQLALAVAYQTDVIVAARVAGPGAAAEYGIAYRLFMFAPTLVTMVLLQLWPAYGESAARGDIDWVRRTVRRSVGLAFLLSAASSIVLMALHEPILQLWIGGSVRPPFALLAGMAVWGVVNSSVAALNVAFNGMNILRFQATVSSIMAVASLILSIALGVRFGVSGVIWGTVLAYVALLAIPTVIYFPRVFAILETRVAGQRADA